MKRFMLLAVIIMIAPTLTPAENTLVAPNGIALFKDYRNREVITPSYREDKNHIRIILGNPVATKAMKENIRTFPDGSVMAKVACSTTKHPKFTVVTVP